MHCTRKFILILAAAVFCVGTATRAMADDYPTRPIRIVVPFAAGGGVDILTRILARNMESLLGQPKPGAGGNVGVELVAKSVPDGYTLLMATTGTHTINPGLYKTLPFDPIKDFRPITIIASVPNLLVVNPAVPAKSVAELVALARQNPGKLNFGSFGNGTSNHLSGELFKATAGIDIVHVPYKSAPQAVADLVGGQLQLAFVNTPLALPQVEAGKLRALAVTGAKRSAATPQFPTMQEAGVKGFVVESWYGLMAPAGTPDGVVAKLHATVLKALADPTLVESFRKQGADVETSTPADFSARIVTEGNRWAEIIRKSGAKLD